MEPEDKPVLGSKVGSSSFPSRPKLRTLMPAGLPPLLMLLLLVAGACDFQLLEPPELPRWDFTLTLPLINRTYPLEGVSDDSLIFLDTTTQEFRIEFEGDLDTTAIDPQYLFVDLPESASQQAVRQTVEGLNANDLVDMPLEQTIRLEIALQPILRLSPFFSDVSLPSSNPIVIPDSIWNEVVVANAALDSSLSIQVIDTATAFESISFIKRMRYLQLDSVSVNEFQTGVFNNGFPTSIDSILMGISSGSLLSKQHQKSTLEKDSTFDQVSDLDTARIGSELGIALRMELPEADADVTIQPGDSAKVEFTIRFSIGGLQSLAITTNRIPLELGEPVPLTLPANIQIISGTLRSTLPDTNRISVDSLSNTMPFDVDFELVFPNFESPLGDSLTFGPYLLGRDQVPIDTVADLSGYTFHNPAGDLPISEFEYLVDAVIREQNVSIPLDGSTLGTFKALFGVGDLFFQEIVGNFFIQFPTVPTTIENIPAGFMGFQFDRLSLILALHNQINLPLTLNLSMAGITDRGDTLTVPIVAPINYPDADPINGDTAHTIIVLDQTSVRTYWLPEGTTDTSEAWFDTTVTGQEASIVDVLNLPPAGIEVGGSAIIQGRGEVAAGKGVWGRFELIAPFAFIMPQDIHFIPAGYTPLQPMDEETQQNIQTALLSATITSSLVNSYPMSGNFVMLISDSTYFPLAFDRFDDIAAGITDTLVEAGGDTVFFHTVQEVLAYDSVTGISHVVVYPETGPGSSSSSPRETRARLIEFYRDPTDSLPAFWIGRLFQVELPKPDEFDAQGHVLIPGDTTQTIALDAEQVAWIASDSTLYLTPFITLYGRTYPRAFQSTNYIHITSFVEFYFISDVFEEQETLPASRLIVNPIPNDTVIVGQKDTTDLNTVFQHPNPDSSVLDLDLSVTTSHAGIATAHIRTIRAPTAYKALVVSGIRCGTAKITVSADDPLDTEDPAAVSFLVTVVAAPPDTTMLKSRATPRPMAEIENQKRTGRRDDL